VRVKEKFHSDSLWGRGGKIGESKHKKTFGEKRKGFGKENIIQLGNHHIIGSVSGIRPRRIAQHATGKRSTRWGVVGRIEAGRPSQRNGRTIEREGPYCTYQSVGGGKGHSPWVKQDNSCARKKKSSSPSKKTQENLTMVKHCQNSSKNTKKLEACAFEPGEQGGSRVQSHSPTRLKPNGWEIKAVERTLKTGQKPLSGERSRSRQILDPGARQTKNRMPNTANEEELRAVGGDVPKGKDEERRSAKVSDLQKQLETRTSSKPLRGRYERALS